MTTLTRNQWPILSVYAGVVVSLLCVVLVDFRVGAVGLSLSVLLAMALRWRLSDAEAGMLRVRRRRVDLTVLGVLGTVLLILALVVPHH